MTPTHLPARTASAQEWAEVFRQHRGWLGTVVRSRVADPHEAADVLQEIAVGLLERQDSPRSIERIEPWLYRVALRQVLMLRRQQGRRRRRDDQWAAQRGQAHEPATLEWVLHQESRELVRQQLAQLRAGDRDILLLKLVERWSYDRIAQHLGLTRHAVEYRLARARTELRQRLNAAIEPEPSGQLPR